MKLLLRKDIPKLGLAGDVVEVSEGYARNYLIPHHLALEPTKANMKAIEEDKRIAEEERRIRRAALEAQAARMRDVEVTIAAAANPEGHLYGSVGPREVAAALRDLGHEVDAKQVQLFKPIRTLDTQMVPVQFADDLTVEVKVWVVREAGAGELEEAEAAPPPEESERDREARKYGYGGGVDALETDL
ncbi:MAG TPA: 50S ribosomal protein L9 [Phycisphaerae bacterium]|jgi:large subunit ribosomal protein L9|nr:50S ribosomal protein L9 [Phycisphaerae bacterium]HOB73628.1 50S ribosomal protein L9 [Phycisphaerae bacterium]HOJ54767.1 50S ribosomal protein L9 [Phycisphaerae bacterium]HOL25881.1 50S ribosomal protein L9 [Phycisphaerae bacterium]HPP21187.1 50S ribosomal protein L9 [Phycisphaerae bacterium]